MKVTFHPVMIGELEMIPKGLVRGLVELEFWGLAENHPNYSIGEDIQNSEKRAGDMRRLAITQTSAKDH